MACQVRAGADTANPYLGHGIMARECWEGWPFVHAVTVGPQGSFPAGLNQSGHDWKLSYGHTRFWVGVKQRLCAQGKREIKSNRLPPIFPSQLLCMLLLAPNHDCSLAVTIPTNQHSMYYPALCVGCKAASPREEGE